MARTDWTLDQTVMPEDMNQIGQEINQNRDDLNNHIADYVRQPGYAVATGSANTYAVTLNPAPTAYTDGMGVVVKINTTNTGASTLNVNGLGAKPIKKPNGNDVSAGNLKAGSIYTFRYNANTGNFILQAEGSGGNAQPADVLTGKTFTNDAGEQVGTMPNRTGHVTGQSISRSGTTLRIRPQPGHYPGDAANSVAWDDPNWVAANIREGVSIFGLTGTYKGLVMPLYYSGTEYVPWVPGYSNAGGSQSKEADHLKLEAYYASGIGQRTYVTDQPVDLTSISRIVVGVETTGYDLEIHLCVSTEKNGSFGTYDRAKKILGGMYITDTGALDVSNLTGSYYIRIHARNSLSNPLIARIYHVLLLP